MTIFLHASGYIFFLLILAKLLSLVVLPLSCRESEFDLCKAPVVEVYPERYESKAPLCEFSGNLSDLLFVQEEFAFSQGFVIVVGGLWVLGDSAADEPAL